MRWNLLVCSNMQVALLLIEVGVYMPQFDFKNIKLNYTRI